MEEEEKTIITTAVESVSPVSTTTLSFHMNERSTHTHTHTGEKEKKP
jgi:hypothetical protein